MTKDDLKDLKRALWEVQMKAQNKNIPYLEAGDIYEIYQELKAGGKLNLSQEAYEFYKKDFDFQQVKERELAEAAAQGKIIDWKETVENDTNRAIDFAVKQNNNLPWQLRRNEKEIENEIKRITSGGSVGYYDYRERLAKYLGGKLDKWGNKVEIDERVINERLIQKDFENKQAEKKNKEAAKRNVPEGLLPPVIE